MNPQQRSEYVERFARVLEEGGESRIAGRIYAHLATAEEPYLSLQELADQLGVSRASVSINTRRLIAIGMVRREAVPGARGDHYALTSTGATAMIERVAQAARVMADLAAEGVRLQADAVTPGTQSLRMMAEVYSTLASVCESHVRSLSGSPQRRHRWTSR